MTQDKNFFELAYCIPPVPLQCNIFSHPTDRCGGDVTRMSIDKELGHLYACEDCWETVYEREAYNKVLLQLYMCVSVLQHFVKEIVDEK